MNLSKTLFRRTLIILIIAGIALSLAVISNSILKGSTQTTQTSPALPNTKPIAETSFGLPVRLKIPKLNVDTQVKPMGLASDKDMEAPSGPRNTGWFKFGTRPGNKGSAVIAGHYGRWQNGENSVFDNLGKLNKGDSIYVKDANGVTSSFVVREFRTYDPNEYARDVFVSTDGKAHLNLITCEGIWNETQKSYSNRLVVFADKATEY